MSAAVKYTLGRIGLFVIVVAALWPVEMNIFLKLMVALLFSAALSFFLLRRWRDEMAEDMAAGAERRRSEKERLRAALAGDDQAAGTPGAEADQPAGTPGAEADQPGSSAERERGSSA
ncbi:DUF4229 domain-containing protein [Micromonospora sp. FIMYZ51]|uniref:DUF4229 domain-containing protein n=1 Tax=Micromonospora sp. FIMYZ51 TaxID=3051832 RepID=UPI00311F0D00